MMDRKLPETCRVLLQKNKLEKLVHLVGLIIRIYHYARSSERQMHIQYERTYTVYLIETYALKKIKIKKKEMCHFVWDGPRGRGG